MKRWYYIVIGGVLLTGLVYIYLHRYQLGLATPPAADADGSYSSASSANTAPPVSDAHPARIFWQKVDRSADGFKVDMPSDGKQMQVPAYNSDGGTEQVQMIYAYPDAQTSYSIAWADDPPVMRASSRSVERTLDMARDDALARTQTTLVSESKANRHGLPAREFVGRNSSGGIFNARLILVGRRLYMLISAFPSESARQPGDVARFFDSFTVVNN